jgi:hypothetical protein
MLSDEILEKIFSHSEMHKIPIGAQSTAVSVFTEVIESKARENRYATIHELLSADVPTAKF